MNKKDLIAADLQYLWHPFTQMQIWPEDNPLIIERGEGCYLYDKDGRAYLDGISSLWLTVHGHNHPKINQAMIDQIHKISHSTLLGLTHEPAILLAKKLIEIAPQGLTKVFYSDNGSTAMEVALKMAFQYCQHQGQKQKRYFITLQDAYHGDTIGSVSLGGIPIFHDIFEPLLFKKLEVKNTYYWQHQNCENRKTCAENSLSAIKNLLQQRSEEIIAIVLEPLMQGAGGMIDQPVEYLSAIADLAKTYNILLILDEVATGFGRTGKMFACEHENVVPDIMALSKGITGGYLPLAVTLATEKIYEAFLAEYKEFKTFFHGHSYTANPIACCAALANIDLFEQEHVIENLSSKVKYLHTGLARFMNLRHVGEIRQQGFMIGIELTKNRQKRLAFPGEERLGHKVILRAREKGLILRPLGNVIVLMPPLSITLKEIDHLLEITYQSIQEITEV